MATTTTAMPSSRDEALAVVRDLFQHPDWTTNEDNTAIIRALDILKVFPDLLVEDFGFLQESPRLHDLSTNFHGPIYHSLTSPAVTVDILSDLISLQERGKETANRVDDMLSGPGLSPLHFTCGYFPLSKEAKEIIAFLAKQRPLLIDSIGGRMCTPVSEFMHHHGVHRLAQFVNQQQAQQLTESQLSMIFGVLDTLIEAGGGDDALNCALGMAVEARCLPLVNLLASKISDSFAFSLNHVRFMFQRYGDQYLQEFNMAEAEGLAMIIQSKLKKFDFTLYRHANKAALGHVMTCLANGPSNLTEVGLSIPQDNDDSRLQSMELFVQSNRHLRVLRINGNGTRNRNDKFCVGAAISGLKDRPSENAIQDLTIQGTGLTSTDLYPLLENAPASLSLYDNKYYNGDDTWTTASTTSQEPEDATRVVFAGIHRLTNLRIECRDESNLMLLFEALIPKATNLKNLSIVKDIPDDDYHDDDDDDEDEAKRKRAEAKGKREEASRVGGNAISFLLRHGTQLEVVSLEGITLDAIPIVEQLKGNNRKLTSLKMDSISWNEVLEANNCLLDALQGGRNYSLTDFCLDGCEPEYDEDSTHSDDGDCDDWYNNVELTKIKIKITQQKIDYYVLLNQVGRKELHQEGADAMTLITMLHRVMTMPQQLPPWLTKASIYHSLLLAEPSLWSGTYQ